MNAAIITEMTAVANALDMGKIERKSAVPA
jgi:hypothetical protein